MIVRAGHHQHQMFATFLPFLVYQYITIALIVRLDQLIRSYLQYILCYAMHAMYKNKK